MCVEGVVVCADQCVEGVYVCDLCVCVEGASVCMHNIFGLSNSVKFSW